jgi:hypothetical protein
MFLDGKPVRKTSEGNLIKRLAELRLLFGNGYGFEQGYFESPARSRGDVQRRGGREGGEGCA